MQIFDKALRKTVPMFLTDNRVVLNFIERKSYPSEIPFHPPEQYPEYTGCSLDPRNEVYAAVRDTLYRLRLDCNKFDTKNWNPFREIIQPGMTVFVKPNTVVHSHERGKEVFSVIVHASVLRPILDYVCIALKNQGKIIIGDAPLIFSNFEKAMLASYIKELLEWYRHKTPISIDCIDLRIDRGVRTWLYGRWGRKPVDQDPKGYTFVNLEDRSSFNGIDPRRLRIAVASYRNMLTHHSNGKHEYLFPKSFLESDVVINISKLKTHRRTSVTLALKNFMGIPALKDSLPHFRTGSVEEGGDQYIYPSARKRLVTRLHDQVQTNSYLPVKFLCAVAKKFLWNTRKILPFKDEIYEGMWYGNDTLWRTLLDLNKVVYYGDKNGNLSDKQQRKIFCIIDGIHAGQKDGPLSPDPVQAGVLVAGFNPVAVDAVGTTLMGFDINKIPLIKRGLESHNGINPLYFGTIEDIRVIFGEKILNLDELAECHSLKFEPHPNWKGHLELNE